MPKVKRNCDNCGKVIFVYVCPSKNYEYRFCSKECKCLSYLVKRKIGNKNKLAMIKNWQDEKYRERQKKSYQNRHPVTEETRKKISEATKKRIAEGRFNLKPLSGENHPWYGRKHSPEEIEKNRIAHIGKKQSPETIAKRIKRGADHHSWKGGITQKNTKIRNSKKYINWRTEVFKRDNYTCQMCNNRGVYLEAHHIKSFSKYPHLRLEIDNGITLCLKCHCKIDKNRAKMFK